MLAFGQPSRPNTTYEYTYALGVFSCQQYISRVCASMWEIHDQAYLLGAVLIYTPVVF